MRDYYINFMITNATILRALRNCPERNNPERNCHERNNPEIFSGYFRDPNLA
jgi:hypothetical protein